MKKSGKYRIANTVLKIIIVAAAFWFLYRQIFIRNDFKGIENFFISVASNPDFKFLLLIVTILMGCNWSLEAVKWKIMISKVEKISFLKALEAVFAGITVSFFTPNRIGDFGGRIFFLDHADRVKGALISIFGSLSQLLVTILAGNIALIYFLKNFISLDALLFYTIAALLIVSIVLILLLYFNLSLIEKYVFHFDFMKRFRQYSQIFELYSTRELSLVLLLSMIRYIIFTSQYILLLRMMEVNAPVLDESLMISLTFLVMSIPTFFLTEFSLRSIIALQFIGLLSSNNIGIVTASFSLFMINIAFPAILGAVFVLRLKFFRN